jgi:hypothetical protein
MVVIIRKITLTFLRICINLTNSSSDICESLNDTPILPTLTNIIRSEPQRYYDTDFQHESNKDMSEELTTRESRFELLLLSLGLMINFVQESDKLKTMVLTSDLSNNLKTIFQDLISRDVIPLKLS